MLSLVPRNASFDQLCEDIGIGPDMAACRAVLVSLHAAASRGLEGDERTQSLHMAGRFCAHALNVLDYYAPGFYEDEVPEPVICARLAQYACVEIPERGVVTAAAQNILAHASGIERHNPVFTDMRGQTGIMHDAVFLRMLINQHDLELTLREARSGLCGPTHAHDRVEAVEDCLRIKWPDTALARDNIRTAQTITRLLARRGPRLILS